LKLLINWQVWDLNVHLQDLNQHRASQQGLPRRLSGDAQTETTKITETPQQNSNMQRISYKDALPKNQGTTGIKQKPVTMGNKLFTGHCHLKGHLFKLISTNNSTCDRCLEKMNLPHISYVIAYIRFCHLEHYFIGPSDHQGAPLNNILHFV
jgi:hypothetical protein